MDRTINIKLVILGKGRVGKTSIVKKFLNKGIPSEYLPTIGSITSKKEYKLKEKEVIIRVNIWDFGGQRSFNPINPALYTNIDVAILVFDLSRPIETLENLKKDFLNTVDRYSEDYISIIVGNKLDLFSANDNLREALDSFLDKNDHILLMSAKTGEKVSECFELLLYTFLRKAELLAPDIVSENTANDFIDSIGKSEKTLENNLVNIDSIDNVLQKIKPKSKVRGTATAETENRELKYYEFIQQELNKVWLQKNDTIDQFLINLTELEKTLKHLRKSQIKSVKEVVENLKGLVFTSKKNTEHNLDLIQKLNREEKELMIIHSKLRQEGSESNPENLKNL